MSGNSRRDDATVFWSRRRAPGLYLRSAVQLHCWRLDASCILSHRMDAQIKASEPEITFASKPAWRNSTAIMVALAAVAALAVVAPFCFLGNASGHDFEFHLASWMDVAQQWREGVLYPRWAAFANWGFGEPRFIFYPPASWMLGAALSFVFPWNMVPGVFIWLALVVAGVSMYALAKEWLPTADAMAAAVLFALNPYHLLVVYWRSDFAELLVSALVPLAVLYAMRTVSTPRRAVVPLALVTAAVWLGNAPAAVVVSYGIALVLVVESARKRNLGPLIYGGSALAIGLALAAFYLIPAVFEQPWVNIAEALSVGLRFSENFLFTHTADLEHTRFNFIVSCVAIETIAATFLGGVILGRWRRKHRELWWVLLALAGVSTLLMFPLTSPIWAHVPKLRYVQFPWRWLLLLNVPFAFFVAAGTASFRGIAKHAAWAVALAVLAITGFLLTRSNWWDVGAGADFYEAHFSTGKGYFGADEYGPRESDHYDLDENAPLVSLRSAESRRAETKATIKIEDWAAVHKRFVVHSQEPVFAALRLENYPAWGVEVNGKRVAPSSEHSGQTLVPLSAGTSRVQIAFATTPDRWWGDITSAITAVGVAGAMLIRRRRAARQPP
jgi:hypothetical protein